MGIQTTITDGFGSGGEAKVTSRGQLITAPLDFSTPATGDLTSACVATNFFAPVAGQQLVITDIFINTDRNTPVAGIIVEVFEACSATSLTPFKGTFKIDLSRQAAVSNTGLNFLMTEGKWLNAKISVSTGTTSITIAGYFITSD